MEMALMVFPFFLDALESLCGKSEVQLSHYSAHSGQFGCQRLSALTENQLLLHVAP